MYIEGYVHVHRGVCTMYCIGVCITEGHVQCIIEKIKYYMYYINVYTVVIDRCYCLAHVMGSFFIYPPGSSSPVLQQGRAEQ